MEDRDPYHLERIWSIKLLHFPFNLSEPQFQQQRIWFIFFFKFLPFFLRCKAVFFFSWCKSYRLISNLPPRFLIKGEKISAWCIHKLGKIRLCVSTRRRHKICLGWKEVDGEWHHAWSSKEEWQIFCQFSCLCYCVHFDTHSYNVFLSLTHKFRSFLTYLLW